MMDDLSTEHRPVSDFLDRESLPRDHELDDAQLASFFAEGYVAGIRVLDDEQVDVLRRELETLLDPAHGLFHEYHANESADPERILVHALGAWRVAPAFHDLVWHPAITVPAAQLLGGAVRLWHDQLFLKPAREGGVVAWHQDYSYWTRTRPMQHLTCWIPLDDVDEERGTLQYVPRSHRWNLLPITGLAGEMNAIESVLTDEQRAAFHPVALELARGVASFHHPLTVHGSAGNSSPFPRRAVALNFCLDGTTSATNDPLLQGVPVIPEGAPLSGQFFPLLYDPTE